jgi:uncharacterized repeat protein (TIGR03803 family)
MKPNPDGSWSESVIHMFLDGDPLGDLPVGSVAFDRGGNLYSTTLEGGIGFYGTIFELTPTGNGWTGSVLHAFYGDPEGAGPAAGVLLDKANNIYGTTAGGGADNQGTVFKLGHVSVRNWYHLVLHSFTFGATDGPGTLISDSSGNLYGVSDGNWGAVYELIPNRGSSGWTYKVLHQFDDGLDGGDPNGGLLLDSAGNLYGTTVYGGGCGGGIGTGVAFKLTPNADGTWSETVLYAFGCLPTDPEVPASGLTFDTAGNLYGEAGGGPNFSQGIVFKLSPSSNGTWSVTTLHSFFGGSDGQFPNGGVVLDSSGNIYGTTQAGGTYGEEEGGIAFKITP